MSAAKQITVRGQLLFAVLFLGFAAFLLSQLGTEAKFSSKGKLFAQPAFWPGVGVAGMVFFGLLHCLYQWRGSHWLAELAEGVSWLRAFEYFAWFMVYVFATPVIGYLTSTLLMMLLLALRAGYRDRKMLLSALCTGLVIVLLFKTMLGVKIPGGAVYEYLPAAARTFMIVNF